LTNKKKQKGRVGG